MHRDLGREAENYFATLCSHAGIIANRSGDNDTHGWDFYVEIPVTDQHDKPRDEVSCPVACKVQIKATLDKKLTKDIKLSALEPIVKALEPAFFCLFVYQDSHDPVAVHLLHVDEKFCGKLLRRLREHSAVSDPKPLNKRTLRVDFSTGIQLVPVTGDTMRHAMLDAVGNDYGSYLAQKRCWLNSVGYEDGAHRLQITFAGEADKVIEDVLDLFIGLKPDIDVSSIVATKTRFDISMPDNELSGSGEIKAGIVDLKPTFEGQLTFRDDPLAVPVKIRARFYAPPAEIGLPLDRIKIRAVTPDFELIFRGPNAIFSLKWDPNKTRPLAELWRTCWFMTRVMGGNSVHIGFVKEGQEIELRRLDLASVPSDSLGQMNGEGFASLFEGVNRALEVCRHQGLDPDEVIVNEPLVMEFRQQTMLLHGLLLREPGTFKVTIPWEDYASELASRRVAIVAGNKTRIGSSCFAFSFAAIATHEPAESDQEGVTFYTMESRLGSVKFGGVDQIGSLDIMPLLDELAEQLESEGFAVILNA